MATKSKGQSTAESLRKTRTYGKFRCHNPSCMERIQPGQGDKTAKMPDLRYGIQGPLGKSHSAAYSRTGLGCKPEIGGRKIKREGSTVIWR